MNNETNHCIDCEHCAFTGICRDYLFDEPLPYFISSLERKVSLTAGQTLYSTGEPVKHLFALRSGFMKQVNSKNQIINLLVPGELVNGEDGYPGRHRTTTVAVTDAQVCQLDYARLYPLSQVTTNTFSHAMSMLSKAAFNHQRMTTVLMQPDAKRKIAAFILLIHLRFCEAGFTDNCIKLPVIYRELAQLLGVSTVTLRRGLNDMISGNIISLTAENLRINNLPALKEIVPDLFAESFFPAVHVQ